MVLLFLDCCKFYLSGIEMFVAKVAFVVFHGCLNFFLGRNDCVLVGALQGIFCCEICRFLENIVF